MTIKKQPIPKYPKPPGPRCIKDGSTPKPPDNRDQYEDRKYIGVIFKAILITVGLAILATILSCSNPFAAEDKTLIFEGLTATQVGRTRVCEIRAEVIHGNINNLSYTFSYKFAPRYGAYFADNMDSTITTSLNTVKFMTEKRSGVREYTIKCKVNGDNIIREKSVVFTM